MPAQKTDIQAGDPSEYQIVRVEKTAAPKGAKGDNWYTYTIERNSLTNIVGNRCGTLEQVMEYVRAYVANINTRHGNGGYSPWMTRKGNKQPAK